MSTPVAAESPVAPVVPTRIADLVARLNRLVQRATTYPEGHATVRLSATPFIESLRQALGESGRISIMVGREALLVASGAGEPVPQIVPWLSGRLFDRGVATLTFDPALDIDEALRLARWLGVPGEIKAGDSTTFVGCTVAPFDYSRVRFVETPAAPANADEESLRLWRSIAQDLAPDEGATPDWDDPESLAASMREMLSTNEGGGVGALATKITTAGKRLPPLAPHIRRSVGRRLAGLVSALSPELRVQLLAVAPTDSPDKLALLGEICSSLSHSAQLEMMRSVAVAPCEHSRLYLDLLVKLVELSAQQPELNDALEARFALAGLPADLVHYDRDEARMLLTEALTPASASGDSDAVRQGEVPTVTASGFDPRLFHNPRVERDAGRLSDIALHLLGTATTDSERLAAAAHLGGGAAALVAAGRDHLVARTALAFERLGEVSAPDLQDVIDRFREECQAPAVVDAALARLRSRAQPTHEDIALVRAGFPAGAAALVAALMPATAPPGLRATLTQLDGASLTVVLQHAREANGMGRLLGILHDVDPARAWEAAFGALGEGDADVRVEAYRVLLTSGVTVGRLERVVSRALADPDPRAALVALDVVKRQPTTATVRAIAAHLSEPTQSRHEKVDLAAVHLLRHLATPEAVTGLSTALLARRHQFDARSRRLSRAMAEALEPLERGTTMHASRAWRRSMAGLVSRVLGDSEKR